MSGDSMPTNPADSGSCNKEGYNQITSIYTVPLQDLLQKVVFLEAQDVNAREPIRAKLRLTKVEKQSCKQTQVDGTRRVMALFSI